MPTLLIAFGIRFFFYLDEHRPIHVHVSYGGKVAKIELEPQIKVVYYNTAAKLDTRILLK